MKNLSTLKEIAIMKKSYLMMVAIAAMFAGCSENETITEAENASTPVKIGFDAFNENVTRATATGVLTTGTAMTAANGGFGVWGFKASTTGTATGTPATINVSATGFTKVFENVKVWYENESTLTKGFTYTVPKYWDKNMEYVFFAYAPYDETKATLDFSKGKITIADIPQVQDLSTRTTATINSKAYTKYDGTTTTSLTDYLMAEYEPGMKYGSTNQTTYTGHEKTVGFTFGHMLSKFNVNLKAAECYSGVKEIKVTNLTINNMPALGAANKTAFTQTSPTASAGTYTPAAYTSDLKIIGGEGATSTDALYVLAEGSMTGSTITVPTANDQAFHYYVAPNDPNDPAVGSKYLVDITYDIAYVDGINETVTKTDLDLSTITTPLSSFTQNYVYTLTINIGLQQIYFTVDEVSTWDTEGTGDLPVE